MRRAFSLLLLGLLVVGCSNNSNETLIGGAPRLDKIRRIVSLSPSTTEIVLSFDIYHQVVGRTQACNYPSAASQIPVVASVKPDYEKIGLIKPDLIVFDDALYSEADKQKMTQLGIPIFEFKGNTIPEFISSLRDYAQKVGGEADISTYIDKIIGAQEAANAEPFPNKPKVAMLMASSGDPYAVGTKSLQADLIRAAGGEPVGPATAIYSNYPAETLIRENPDVIFVVGTVKDAQGLLADPRFKTVAAIAKRHVSVANPDVALRRGSRINTFIDDLHLKMKEFTR